MIWWGLERYVFFVACMSCGVLAQFCYRAYGLTGIY